MSEVSADVTGSAAAATISPPDAPGKMNADHDKFLSVLSRTGWKRKIKKVAGKQKTKDWDPAKNKTAYEIEERRKASLALVVLLVASAKARFHADRDSRIELLDEEIINKKASREWRDLTDKDKTNFSDAIIELYKTLKYV